MDGVLDGRLDVGWMEESWMGGCRDGWSDGWMCWWMGSWSVKAWLDGGMDGGWKVCRSMDK